MFVALRVSSLRLAVQPLGSRGVSPLRTDAFLPRRVVGGDVVHVRGHDVAPLRVVLRGQLVAAADSSLDQIGVTIERQDVLDNGKQKIVVTITNRSTGLFKGTAASRRKRAIATLSALIGAQTLARAVDDPDLSKEILAAARDAFGS